MTNTAAILQATPISRTMIFANDVESLFDGFDNQTDHARKQRPQENRLLRQRVQANFKPRESENRFAVQGRENFTCRTRRWQKTWRRTWKRDRGTRNTRSTAIGDRLKC